VMSLKSSTNNNTDTPREPPPFYQNSGDIDLQGGAGFGPPRIRVAKELIAHSKFT
jgi:hypothetical protein